jgi:putative FmdB family regulatory protein
MGMGPSLPNGCSTCQIDLIVSTLAVMPLYEYRCNDCSAVFELLRPMADREVAAVCPSCESRASMPLISRVAVHAGSGPGESPSMGGGGGGCCGGSCGCGAN